MATVKKTAIKQAVQSRMAMHFNVADEAASTSKVGFAFGKSADSKMFENCVNILRTERARRSRPDIVMLLSLFEGNDFFAKIDYEVKLELASVMGLLGFDEEDVVFKQGDKADYFYIVLTGTVDVFVDHMGIKFKACTYQSGGSFGERALITAEKRAATVVCVSDCSFLVISKRDYIRVLRDVHEREFNQKISFLKSVRYFEYLPNLIYKELVSKTTKKRFGKNQVICQEGEKKTHLYIVRHGECRVLKMVNLGSKVVHLETRKLTSRDFFGEDAGVLNNTSVVSLSFAECYCIHFNDLKNFANPHVLKIVENLSGFGRQFEWMINENTLLKLYKEQQQWEIKKDSILKGALQKQKTRK
jgi:CRP-like cAMP-binding protein